MYNCIVCIYIYIPLSIHPSIYLSIYLSSYLCPSIYHPMPQNLHVLLTFDKVRNPLRLPRESTSERPKVLRTRQFFAFLTSKCASRHNGVRFFNISTSKSGPNLVCFVHFDLAMCFAPQLRAIFHLSSGQMTPQSLEKHGVSRLSYLFAHLHLLSSDSFSSLIFSLLLFSSL